MGLESSFIPEKLVLFLENVEFQIYLQSNCLCYYYYY